MIILYILVYSKYTDKRLIYSDFKFEKLFFNISDCGVNLPYNCSNEQSMHCVHTLICT